MSVGGRLSVGENECGRERERMSVGERVWERD